MPRIPISDIPNAPRPVAQPTGGNLSGVNLGRAQSLLQQDTISPDAFHGQARGMQAIAAGLGDLGKGARDVGHDVGRAALHLQNLMDEDMLFKGKHALSVRTNTAREEIASKPDAYKEWGGIVKRHLAEGYEEFLKANPDLSERAKTLLEREYLTTESLLYGRAQEAGIAKLTENVKGGKLFNAENFAEVGDWDGAEAELEEGRKLGILSELEYDLQGKRLRKTAELAKQDALRMDRPDLALEQTRDENATPWLSPSERIAQERGDRAAVSVKDSEVMDSVSNWHFNGEVKTIDEARKRIGGYGDAFVHGNRADLERMFARRGVSDEGAAREILQEMRLNGVPEDKEDRMAALGRVKVKLAAVLNPNEFTELRDLADEFYNGKPRPILDEQLDHWEADIIDLGGFGGGYDKKKANAGDKEEIEKRKNMFLNKSKARQALDDWRKNNPGKSDDEVRMEFQNIIQRNGWMPLPKGPGAFKRALNWTFGIGDSPAEMRKKAEERRKKAESENPYKSAGATDWERDGTALFATGE